MNWIKTSEKRPKNGQTILGAAVDGSYRLLTYQEKSDVFIDEDNCAEQVPSYVDYWITKPVYPTMENREFRFEK